ncbi:MAG: hypothetical protein ABIN67_10765 [Ferruginibacter sp.]
MIKIPFSKIIVNSTLLFTFTLATAQTSNPLSAVSVKGNKFVAANGKTIVYRGLDTSDPDKLFLLQI